MQKSKAEKFKEWSLAHREERREYNKKRYQMLKEHIRETSRLYHQTERWKEMHRNHEKRPRLKLIALLGGKCVWPNCGTTMDLEIDHINGGGCKDFREKKFRGLYRYYLLHLEEAKEKLQVLCCIHNDMKVELNHENTGKPRKK